MVFPFSSSALHRFRSSSVNYYSCSSPYLESHPTCQFHDAIGRATVAVVPLCNPFFFHSSLRWKRINMPRLGSFLSIYSSKHIRVFPPSVPSLDPKHLSPAVLVITPHFLLFHVVHTCVISALERTTPFGPAWPCSWSNHNTADTSNV